MSILKPWGWFTTEGAGTEADPATPVSLSDPATSAAEITPSDSVPLTTTTRALYVGTGGEGTVLEVILTDDETPVQFVNVPSGTLLPIRVDYVTTTTDCEDLVALL